MELQFSKNEMYIIINALDFYSRIWIGQYDKILSDIRWYRKCSQLDKLDNDFKYLLFNIRHLTLPEIDSYGWNGSYGIFSPDINFKAAVAYNMQQEFRYKLAYFLHPEGGVTVDFCTPMPAELDPYPFPKAKCEKIKDEIFVNININKEQLEIIKNSLKIEIEKLNGNITNLFKFYTNNKNVFKLTEQIDKLLETVDKEREIPQDIINVLDKINSRED